MVGERHGEGMQLGRVLQPLQVRVVKKMTFISGLYQAEEARKGISTVRKRAMYDSGAPISSGGAHSIGNKF